MEIVDGTVNYVRSSRSKCDMDTMYVAFDDQYGESRGLVPFHVDSGSYNRNDPVKLLIEGDMITLA